MDNNFTEFENFYAKSDGEPQTFEPYGRDDQDTEPSGRSRRSRGSGRSRYAKQIQLASETALQNIKDNNSLIQNDWASPLSAAPSAICVMAILLRTAGEEKAAGLKVGSTTVVDFENGNKVLGELP
jgi:hypothetical protein